MSKEETTLKPQNQKSYRDIHFDLLTFIFTVYCAIMPFEEVLAGATGSFLKWVGIALMVFSVCYMRGICITKDWLLLAVWLLYCLLSVLWAESNYWWAYFVKMYISLFVFAFIVGQIPPELIDLRQIKAGLVIGTLIAAGLLIFSPTASAYVEGRRTIILWDTHMDPNVLSTVFIMGFYALLSLLLQSKRNYFLFKFICYLLLGVIAIGIIYTGSRGALISLVASLFVFVFFAQKEKGSLRRKSTVWLLAAAAAVVLFIFFFVPEDYLKSRFSFENILGLNEYRYGAHNRYTIWLRSWELFKRNPIIGYGCGNFFSAIATVYKQCAAHNIVVLSLIECGILGSIPLFLFIFLTAKKLYRSGNMIIFSMLISILIMSLTLDSLPYKYFWTTIIISNLEAEKALAERKDDT